MLVLPSNSIFFYYCLQFSLLQILFLRFNIFSKHCATKRPLFQSGQCSLGLEVMRQAPSLADALLPAISLSRKDAH